MQHGISLQDWLGTPRAQLAMRWEKTVLSQLWPRFYGHSALAIGSWGEHLPVFPPRWRVEVVGHEPGLHCGALSDLWELPLMDGSADLAILRHSLAFARSPHRLLRETDRILSQRGQLLILNFSPYSFWGVASKLPLRAMQLPHNMRLLSANRLVDWLHLLDFRVEDMGHYGPRTPLWAERLGLNRLVQPGYFILARKQRLPVRPLQQGWRQAEPLWGGQVAMGRSRSNARVIPFPQRNT